MTDIEEYLKQLTPIESKEDNYFVECKDISYSIKYK